MQLLFYSQMTDFPFWVQKYKAQMTNIPFWVRFFFDLKFEIASFVQSGKTKSLTEPILEPKSAT